MVALVSCMGGRACVAARLGPVYTIPHRRDEMRGGIILRGGSIKIGHQAYTKVHTTSKETKMLEIRGLLYTSKSVVEITKETTHANIFQIRPKFTEQTLQFGTDLCL